MLPVRYPSQPAVDEFPQELIPGHKERILLKNSADDDHPVRPHDVNHRVTAKLPEMVRTDDRVVVMTLFDYSQK